MDCGDAGDGEVMEGREGAAQVREEGAGSAGRVRLAGVCMYVCMYVAKESEGEKGKGKGICVYVLINPHPPPLLQIRPRAKNLVQRARHDQHPCSLAHRPPVLPFFGCLVADRIDFVRELGDELRGQRVPVVRAAEGEDFDLSGVWGGGGEVGDFEEGGRVSGGGAMGDEAGVGRVGEGFVDGGGKSLEQSWWHDLTMAV